jgi:hypothetical protein
VLQFHLKFLKVNIKHFHVEKNVSTAWGWLFHPTLLLSLDGTLLPNGELQRREGASNRACANAPRASSVQWPSSGNRSANGCRTVNVAETSFSYQQVLEQEQPHVLLRPFHNGVCISRARLKTDIQSTPNG